MSKCSRCNGTGRLGVHSASCRTRDSKWNGCLICPLGVFCPACNYNGTGQPKAGEVADVAGRAVVDAAIAALSADGPVVVIDGKVAELGAAVARAVVDTDQEGLASDWVRGLIDAAREVADRG